MAFIKNLTKLVDKFKKMSASELNKASKKSINWLKKNLGGGGKDSDTKSKDPKNWVPANLSGQDIEFRKAISKTGYPLIGMLYFYTYSPKHAKTLPYYDTFPCVIPINYKKGGMLGINFHYLPPILRAQLLDALLSIKTHTAHNGKPDDYFKISYDYLKGFSKSNLVKPTIKRYLFSHVRSNFAHIRSEEWENAVMLPVEQFQKENKRTVWKDSRGVV